MHTAKALDRAQGIVADAARRSAKVQILGQVPDKAAFRRGYFMQPTVVSDIAEDAPLMVEEQFCPAVPVATYRDVDDAIARANATMYGFGGSVWSRDILRASDLARGGDSVRQHPRNGCEPSAYGGVKQKANRHAPGSGIREYMQI
jgi:acyl-CoA reductase-like NAD-dependent aldehyde dehydrogenase